jgi:hypothetical protein
MTREDWTWPRERCHARTRTGDQCKAKAIEGGFVCRVHGGSAPQVAIAARRRVLTGRLFAAYETWRRVHDPGRPRGQWMSRAEVNAAGAIVFLERAIDQHDRDVQLIQLMRAEVADPHPETTAMLLEIARERLSMTGR